MPAALREWWRGVLAAMRRTPWRNGGSGGAQGAGGASTGGAPAEETPADGPSYNQLVREAMTDQGRTDRMDTLDRHRTDDHVWMFTTKIRYCTGCILVLVLALAGLLTLMGILHLTSFWMLAPVIGGFMTPVVALSRQLARVISQAGTTSPTLSDDRRAVVPAQRPEPRAEADDPA